MGHTTTKNKHGRVGVKRQHTIASERAAELKAAHSQGYRAGFDDGKRDGDDFLALLLSKRRLKDMQGLLAKRLGVPAP